MQNVSVKFGLVYFTARKSEQTVVPIMVWVPCLGKILYYAFRNNLNSNV